MTKDKLIEKLNGMTEEQVVDLAWKQEQKIAEIRGYKTGLTREGLAFLGKKTLIRGFVENEKNFKLNTI